MTGRAGHFGLLLDTSVDANFANVSALLHLDGADGSTSFPDVKGKVWTPAGQAQIDTAQSKFGGASLLLDGSGDYLTTPSSADFAYGTGDFTWEAWVRLNATSGANQYVIDHGANQGTLFVNGGSNRIGYYNASTGPSGDLFSPPHASAVLTVGTWAHVAVARQSGTTRIFRDGTLLASKADTYNYLAQAVSIGRYGAGALNFNGWIDELRITKGVARYTGNFSVPTAPFQDA